MRIAVMSDIHGFSLALDTVRADLAEQGPFDEIVVAGDICEVGPDPQGVVDRLRETGWPVIQGNTDYDLVEAAEWATGIEEHEYWVEHLTDDAIAKVPALEVADLDRHSRLAGPARTGQCDEVHVGSIEHGLNGGQLGAAPDQRRQWLGHGEVRSC